MTAGDARLSPLAKFRGYRAEWLRHDLTAGLAIAAVGLPSAIAYPAIAGLPPEMGIYSSIVPLVAYALFGPSRFLIVGPDAGTMIVLAAVLLSLAPASAGEGVTIAAAIAAIVGVLCVLGSWLRLGFVANFLSRPILLGFMAGISLSIIIGQIGRFTGVKIESEGLIRPIVELLGKSDLINWPTLMLGLGLFILLRLLSAWLPAIPGPLVAIVLAIALSMGLDLQALGIAVVGNIPSQLPTPMLPIPSGISLTDLILGASAVLLVSFGAGIVTARSFGTMVKEPVDANRELIGFGAANIGAGLFGGIPVTASDSRTAINVSMGGKSQVAGIVAALTLAIAVLFLTDALQVLPRAALGAILVSAAISLIDIRAFTELWRVSRIEFVFALIGMSGAIVLGVLQGVIIAVAATLLYLLIKGLRPRDAMLGRIAGRDGFFKLHRHPDAKPIPGMAICIFQGSLLFFNVDFAKSRFEAIAAALPPGTQWLILDASAIVQIDSTAAALLDEVQALLAARDIAFGIAELHNEPRALLERSGTLARLGSTMVFDDLEDARAEFMRRAASGT
ncbi:SulP family inorganic anion transporter [Taklimakanibacter deserti]|uniref:SulP family inorganic anion transporter n=1 Tax=Taklimakanibacter deserti TaxID=2267839 RepID=UPI000E647F38